MSTLSTKLNQQADQAAVNAMRAGAMDEALVSALVDRTLYGAELMAQKRLEEMRSGSRPSTTAILLAYPMQTATVAIVGLAVLCGIGTAVVYGGGSTLETGSTTQQRLR